MKVELIDHMGNDLRVVNAARVSFDKESEWVEGCSCQVGLDGHTPHPVLSDKDAKLIAYLAREGHWSPFAHTCLSFRVKAPIFVARQLAKHQVGLSWNETSRRYVDSEPEFYWPDAWRKRADNAKQGSSEETIDLDKIGLRGDGSPPHESGWEASLLERIGLDYEDALETYELLLAEGVCPEQARMVLPQSMMTEWIWTGSLYAFARVCKLRLDPHAQAETREVAQRISEILEPLFPVSWKALMEEA